MLRDVFYFGAKPNVHPRERPANNIDHARSLSTTDHFWIINEYCDYRGFDWDFDFDFLPDEDVWAEHHNNAWPSVYQKDSGTWLCSKEESNIIVYRNDVTPLTRKKIKDHHWVITRYIDENLFDWGWHPDPTDPPYIYQFGTQWNKTGGPRYIVDGATEVKYVDAIKAKALIDKLHWIIPETVDVSDFDFSWHPDDSEPPYIYQFGTQWSKLGGPLYIVDGATEVKYVPYLKAQALPDMTNWYVPDNIEASSFDFSWRPDVEDKPYIYQFGTQYYNRGGPVYLMPGATEYKYVDSPRAKVKPCHENWIVPNNIAVENFDWDWIPDPDDPAYIYEWNTQWQRNGGIKFAVPGATEVKYMTSDKIKALPTNTIQSVNNWQVQPGIKIDEQSFDFSWHPDNTEEPYIYVFGNNLYPAEECATVTYTVPGATQTKYINDIVIKLAPNDANWVIPDNADVTEFDFSWMPKPTDPAYIYQFGTQWQKTGGPSYVVEGATEVKYMEGKVKALPTKENWRTGEGFKVKDFDYSWHPDTTEEPYIYVFGNNLYSGEECPTIGYIVPGATQIKYIHDIVATLDQNTDNWHIPDNIDVTDFDFSWIPNPKDPPFIYQFGTQWQKTGGPWYEVEGATEIKYMTGKARALPNKNNWRVGEGFKIKEFDYSWHPDATEEAYIYIFGNNLYPAEECPTIGYMAPGGTELKYVHDVVATLDENRNNWHIPSNVDVSEFDFSWVPNPKDPAYIYQFGTQWQKTGGPWYEVAGATEVKYMEGKAKALPNAENWHILDGYEIKDFDYSWHPDATEEPYIYVFGNKWNSAEIEPTIEYRIEGATEKKYINDTVAQLMPDKTYWTILHPIDENEFDFSWRPNPKDPAYIYVFGNQYYPAERMPTLIYRKDDAAVDHKYIKDVVATLVPDMSRWQELIPVDKKKFDFSWIPDPGDPPYIYVFGNQWYRAEEEPTLEYHAPSATIRKFISEFPHAYRNGEVITAPVLPDMERWVIPTRMNVSDFDFTWRPDPGLPAYIYQFGTDLDEDDGPRYVPKEHNNVIVKLNRVYKSKEDLDTEVTTVPEPTVQKYYIKTTLQDLINEHPDEMFWAMRENIDYSNFDFSWRPSVELTRYVHVFGSPDYQMTQTYFVAATVYNQGYKDFNYVEADKKIDEAYLATLFKPSDMFFVDRGNYESKERFERLKQRYPGIQKTRFLNTWVDTINRCINRSNTDLCWILNSEYDYANFNFNYYPTQWQMKMVHVFGTQWSHWGNTYIVNRETFSEDTKYIKIIEHLSNLNFVKDRQAIATNNLYDIWLVDHGNDLSEVKKTLENKSSGRAINIIAYDTNYIKTFRNLVAKLPQKKEDYIWLCSSVCDYSNFDFSYTVDPFARDNLHIFPSDKQKFGDTFFVDVNKTREVIDTIDSLQAYPKANYNSRLHAKRLPAPVITVTNDTHVGAINNDFNFPYAVFQTEQIDVQDQEPISLWADDTKTITVTSTGATRIIVPREAKNIVKNELYDYPYIKTASKLGSSQPMDIVFLSNGEQCADENYRHLLAATKHTKNRVVRVDGVDGRVAAYHAAAEASRTPWAFTVFAKLKVNNKFDWGWQPDRLQIAKHYIFHAKNPVNGLEYGHQGMIAYNKKLTLANQGLGLDFTLDDPHETVQLLSGVATFNTDPYATWRTAFREVIKLQSDYSDIAAERLNTWTTVAQGEYAEYCLQGAKDAVEFYDSVMGDIDELKQSYEWAWLKEFYRKKYR